MKNLLIFLTVFFLFCFILLHLNNAYAAISYNNGPEPTNPYYMHVTVNSNLFPSDRNGDFWLYVSDSDTNKYFISQFSSSDAQHVNSISFYSVGTGFNKIRVYKDGVLTNMSSFNIYYSNASVTGQKTVSEHISFLNLGSFDESYSDISSYPRNFSYIIHYNTIPIRLNDETVVYPSASMPQYVNEEWFSIISPQNNFSQSGSYNTWSIKVGYQLKESDDFNLLDWEIKPHSTTIKGLTVINNENWVNNLGMYKYRQGYMTANYYVPYGINTIYFTITNTKTGKSFQTPVYTYHNFEGFVDVNNDGKDDRTGLTEDLGGVVPDWNLGYNDSNYQLEDWRIDTFFGNITKIFNSFFNSVSNLTKSIGNMSSIFTVVTSVIPSEIVGLLTASVFLFIVLKIFGR